jgi:hypothetical protein
MVKERDSQNGSNEELEPLFNEVVSRSPESIPDQANTSFDESPAQTVEAGDSWKGSGNELGDLNLGLESFETIATENRPDGSRLPMVLVLLLAIGALGIYFGFFRGRESPEPIPVAESVPEPELQLKSAVQAPKPAFALPSLAASDDVLRRMVGQLTSHPEFIRWTLSENLLRRFAAAVENIANGASPTSHFKQIQVEGVFEAIQVGERRFINPQSYSRYNGIAVVVDSIDVRGAASVYSSFKPLLDEVYQDLGYPGGDFNELLRRAIAKLVSTPVITGQIDLVQKVSSYEFADPEVEGLLAVQKHLLRAGPDNQRIIVGKLRSIARELGISI